MAGAFSHRLQREPTFAACLSKAYSCRNGASALSSEAESQRSLALGRELSQWLRADDMQIRAAWATLLTSPESGKSVTNATLQGIKRRLDRLLLSGLFREAGGRVLRNASLAQAAHVKLHC
jgi:hypothetical protein